MLPSFGIKLYFLCLVRSAKVIFAYFEVKNFDLGSIIFFQIYKKCDNGKYKLETSWQAHSATIWHLDWAHPHHGIILASCSFDKYLRTWMPPVQKNTDFNKRGHSNHNRDYAQEWEMTGDDCVDRRASVTDVRYVTFVTRPKVTHLRHVFIKTIMLH